MNKFFKKTALIVVAFIFFALPFTTSALSFNLWEGTETTNSFTSGTLLYSSTSTCNVSGACTFCHALIVVQNAIAILFQVAIPVAVIFIIIGAIIMMTSGGSESRLKTARAFMTNAAVGLAIGLASWLMINTIVKLIANSSFRTTTGETRDLRIWNRIECE